MELELFAVYIKEDGTIKIEINEELANAYDVSLEKFQEKFDSNNLTKGIEEFVNCFMDNKSEEES